MIISMAIFFYLLASKFSFRDYHQKQPAIRHIIIILALCLHGLIILPQVISETGLAFSLLNSLLLVGFFIALLLFIATWFYPIYLLDVIIYPSCAVILSGYFLIEQPVNYIISFELALHILLSMSAYAILTLCACQSVLLQLQDKQLHHQTKYSFINKLPPLQTMENLLLSGLLVGTVLLTLSLLTGFVFLDNIFAQHLVHKTTFSIIAWFIFIGIITGHQLLGLRGKQLRLLVQLGFVLLLLGYFGSKFVLEYLIGI